MEDIVLEYNIKYKSQVKIFGDKFIEKNKNNCKIIINKKTEDIRDLYRVTLDDKKSDFLSIRLILNNKITDISYLFYNCSSLSSILGIEKWTFSNITEMNCIFFNCSSLLSLPDISKWDTSNIKKMDSIFYNCSSLLSLPDISKWNTSNVKSMSRMFYNCSSLSSLLIYQNGTLQILII